MHSIKSYPKLKYIVYIFKWIPIMVSEGRFFHLFSQIYKFSLNSINLLFQTVLPFDRHFI